MKTFEKLKEKAKERAKSAAASAKVVAKAAVKKEITKQKAAMRARKVAWRRADDGHYYRALGEGIYVHVVGSKAYIADKNLTTAERITGGEEAKHVKSAKATMAVRKASEPKPGKAAPKKFADPSKFVAPNVPKKAAPKKAKKGAAPKKAKKAPKKAKKAVNPMQAWMGM